MAENCPENFENRAALVAAEIARIEGREFEAMRLYKQAIRSAHANGFIHNEAVAYEVAARFYAAGAFDIIANAYLREARYSYVSWGADSKVRQLDRLYPELKKEEPAPGPTSTIVAPVEVLDSNTVIKVSQAVSGEMVLENLIDRVMRSAIEQAGAERGLLIVSRGDELEVQAEATTSSNDVTVHLRHATAVAAALPDSLVWYVMRTEESVILDDASTRNPFSTDFYIVERHARSILCLPLINQAKLIGVLYLENNLTPNVFTPDRITVLKVLASQAAISLENTRLYRDLEDREAKIRRLVDANILGLCIWNLDGAIVGANEAFLRMVQYGREDLVSGRVRWPDLTPAEWRERDERAVAGLKATATAQPYEKEFFRRDGSRVPVLIGRALFQEGGNEGVAFALDLSEQKRAEEALRQTQEDLRQTQAEFAHVNRVMTTGEFAASIAHDVNQPLAAIIASGDSCTAWLANEPPNLDKARAAASRMVQGATQASEIVRRVRALFKKDTLIVVSVDVNEVIGETISFIRPGAERKNISIGTKLDSGLPSVSGDRVQLQQVILNLMINGIEAMAGLDSEPKSLLIRSALLNECELLVSVVDTGPGIDPDQAARLFSPFFTTKPQGIGMGLRIRRSIIEAHGGRLWADKNEPRGATFHFILPLKTPNE